MSTSLLEAGQGRDMNALKAFGTPMDMAERIKRLQRREYMACSLVKQALEEWDREDFDYRLWDEMARVYIDRVEKDE